MPAYLIATIDVADPEQYGEYTKLSPAIIDKFDGKFLARGGRTVSLEGPQQNARVVVLEFPSVEHAQRFYESDEYQHAKSLRVKAASAQFFIVDGV